MPPPAGSASRRPTALAATTMVRPRPAWTTTFARRPRWRGSAVPSSSRPTATDRPTAPTTPSTAVISSSSTRPTSPSTSRGWRFATLASRAFLGGIPSTSTCPAASLAASSARTSSGRASSAASSSTARTTSWSRTTFPSTRTGTATSWKTGGSTTTRSGTTSGPGRGGRASALALPITKPLPFGSRIRTIISLTMSAPDLKIRVFGLSFERFEELRQDCPRMKGSTPEVSLCTRSEATLLTATTTKE
mmetsp:Transcript_9344/g.26274  ORF Transcript_9344/g.26274 Transcript_9344/m.26274 type:complete len:248 (+) Transcript_9344:533-1276(+)